MAKNFPYFKFIASEWMTGDIVFESFSVQGLFINICALYWQRNGSLSLEDINKRFKNPDELIQLTDRFFSVNDGLVSVKFLDEQLIEANHISKVNSENGSKGGRPKAYKTLDKKPTANRPLSDRKANKSKEEEEEEENKNKIKENINKPLAFKFFDSLINLGAEKQLVSDWIAVRKLKKLSNTETVFDNFKSEVNKSGKNINEVLKECVVNSWGGFKSDWLNKQIQQNNISPTKKRVIS